MVGPGTRNPWRPGGNSLGKVPVHLVEPTPRIQVRALGGRTDIGRIRRVHGEEVFEVERFRLGNPSAPHWAPCGARDTRVFSAAAHLLILEGELRGRILWGHGLGGFD